MYEHGNSRCATVEFEIAEEFHSNDILLFFFFFFLPLPILERRIAGVHRETSYSNEADLGLS